MKEKGEFPPTVNSFVIVRHNDPIVDEPHQVEGEVLSVEPTYLNWRDRLLGKKPGSTYDVTIDTKMLGKVKIRGVTQKNLSLVMDPSTVEVE